MNIQLGVGYPTGNTEFITGHVYKHVNGAIYLYSQHHLGEGYGKYLVNLIDGIAYAMTVDPKYYTDLTSQISLQDIKK